MTPLFFWTEKIRGILKQYYRSFLLNMPAAR